MRELVIDASWRENFMQKLVKLIEAGEVPQEQWWFIVEQFRRIELGMSNVGLYCIAQEFMEVNGQVPKVPIDDRVLMRIPAWKENPLS